MNPFRSTSLAKRLSRYLGRPGIGLKLEIEESNIEAVWSTTSKDCLGISTWMTEVGPAHRKLPRGESHSFLLRSK